MDCADSDSVNAHSRDSQHCLTDCLTLLATAGGAGAGGRAELATLCGAAPAAEVFAASCSQQADDSDSELRIKRLGELGWHPAAS